ncbi:MAG TPA: hypothetical protein VII96_04495 [Acidimicrobiales bacterium]
MSLADPTAGAALAAAVNDNSAAYDLVLLAHVLTAVVGLVAVVAAGSFAMALRSALRRGGPLPDATVRYYRPGVNWVGRVLFAVPVLGVALIAMSGGEWGWSDAWVSGGMAVWAVVAMAAEAALWPGERQLQEAVAGVGAEAGQGGGAEPAGDPADLCLRVTLVAAGCAVAFVAVAALMVAKP